MRNEEQAEEKLREEGFTPLSFIEGDVVYDADVDNPDHVSVVPTEEGYYLGVKGGINVEKQSEDYPEEHGFMHIEAGDAGDKTVTDIVKLLSQQYVQFPDNGVQKVVIETGEPIHMVVDKGNRDSSE